MQLLAGFVDPRARFGLEDFVPKERSHRSLQDTGVERRVMDDGEAILRISAIDLPIHTEPTPVERVAFARPNHGQLFAGVALSGVFHGQSPFFPPEGGIRVN